MNNLIKIFENTTNDQELYYGLSDTSFCFGVLFYHHSPKISIMNLTYNNDENQLFIYGNLESYYMGMVSSEREEFIKYFEKEFKVKVKKINHRYLL